jgi:hydroxymethylpyrimidine kinase / phosphomethylpyrimidine kinase / thiamine-phosphate diphosphorylase
MSNQYTTLTELTANKPRPIVMTVSASDSSGLAGMQMDIKVQSALGVHCACVITANTAQHSNQVHSVNAVSDLVFQEQIKTNSELNFSIIKAGLLVTPQQVESIKLLKQQPEKTLVVDPVFKSSSDHEFTDAELLRYFKTNLLDCIDVLTPNLEEAQRLTGIMMLSLEDIPMIASRLLELGVKSVYLKGGHFEGVVEGSQKTETTQWVQDYFTDGKRSFWLSSPKVDTQNTRGTGCALASAIASALALGYSIYDAAVVAKMAINQGLDHSFSLLEQKGSLSFSGFPSQQKHLPYLTQTPADVLNRHRFPSCLRETKGIKQAEQISGDLTSESELKSLSNSNQLCQDLSFDLGLYPIIDSVEWLARLLPLGVTTAQLRIKNLHGNALESEIEKAIELAKKYSCRLFINDFWQIAIDKGAYGVHLGQEDLDDADIDAIYQAGLRLGISTHCHYEVARAHTYRPSYIACGPIFATQTKIMPWSPQGIFGLRYWSRALDYPVVAIGGISDEKIELIKSTGCSGIALITAITLSSNPEEATLELLKKIKL